MHLEEFEYQEADLPRKRSYFLSHCVRQYAIVDVVQLDQVHHCLLFHLVLLFSLRETDLSLLGRF